MLKITQPNDLPTEKDNKWLDRAKRAIDTDDFIELNQLALELEILTSKEKEIFVEEKFWKAILAKVEQSKTLEEEVNIYRIYLEKTQLGIYKKEATGKIKAFEKEQLLWSETLKGVNRKRKIESKINEYQNYLNNTSLNVYTKKVKNHIASLQIEQAKLEEKNRQKELAEGIKTTKRKNLELEQKLKKEKNEKNFILLIAGGIILLILSIWLGFWQFLIGFTLGIIALVQGDLIDFTYHDKRDCTIIGIATLISASIIIFFFGIGQILFGCLASIIASFLFSKLG